VSGIDDDGNRVVLKKKRKQLQQPAEQQRPKRGPAAAAAAAGGLLAYRIDENDPFEDADVFEGPGNTAEPHDLPRRGLTETPSVDRTLSPARAR
jgi:hypothetical protein